MKFLFDIKMEQKLRRLSWSLLLLTNMGLITILVFGCDAILKHSDVVSLPLEICDFHGAIFEPHYGQISNYVNVKNVTCIGHDSTLMVRYGPPPNWFVWKEAQVQDWITKVKDTIIPCYVNDSLNLAYTGTIGIIGWSCCVALSLSFLILLQMVWCCCYNPKTQRARYPPSI